MKKIILLIILITATGIAQNRPQTPIKPYPYNSENITFPNIEAGITLAGTLTLPNRTQKSAAVILITGSGRQNRNESIFGHEPFLVISDYLTKNGIAVLRYDDRGFGESTGNFKKATSLDFANDVESAIAYLKTRKEIDTTKIGLIGHSEGGLIAPMVASKSKDVNFIVMLAGVGINCGDLIILQQKLIAKASGEPEDKIEKSTAQITNFISQIKNSNNPKTLRRELRKTLIEDFDNNLIELPEGITKERFIKRQLNQMTSPWMKYIIQLDPPSIIENVKCSVFAINGSKDLQVPPTENLAAIKKALTKGKNKNFTIKEYPNLNHLFQECETGSPTEYGKIEQTISPLVLQDISEWIQLQTK